MDYTSPGQIIEIPKLEGKWQRQEARYDYERAGTRCPICEHRAGGVPWNGWFSCDMCKAVAIVETGEAFVRIDRPAEVPIESGRI